jgi:hypothetical protein
MERRANAITDAAIDVVINADDLGYADAVNEAIEQAMYGKGERHGGARTPFLEQPWAHYVKLHGRGFATGQAAKKLEEAASTREGAAFESEVFGALVYIGMSVLHERGEV